MFKGKWRCNFGQEKVIFECMACGYQSPKWMGKCPNCGAWNQMEEIIEKAANPKHGVKTKELAGKVQKLNSIKHETTPRVLTDSAEFNRVLGGGIVSGSLVLIGGDQVLVSQRYFYKFVHRYLKRKKYYILLEKNRLVRLNYVQSD